jgi:hypothetical protein
MTEKCLKQTPPRFVKISAKFLSVATRSRA